MTKFLLLSQENLSKITGQNLAVKHVRVSPCYEIGYLFRHVELRKAPWDHGTPGYNILDQMSDTLEKLVWEQK